MDEVPSAVFDSGATSNCGLQSDPFQPTGKPSGKVFHLLTGHTTTASQQAKLLLDVREPAKTVDMVPGLRHNSLLSASKVADAGYVIVLTPDAVNVYNGSDFSRIKVDAVLRGWRDTNGLWRVPLEPNKPPKQGLRVCTVRSGGRKCHLKRVQATIHSQDNTILTRLCWIPRQANLAQSHKRRQLHDLAAFNSRSGEKTFPGI